MTVEEKNLVYNIAWLRKHHAISKRKMAKILGIGITKLNRIESGELPSSLGGGALVRMHAYFGICTDELVYQRFFEE